MNTRHQPSPPKTSSKLCILLMDSNPERRALRTRIMPYSKVGQTVVAPNDDYVNRVIGPRPGWVSINV